jgi:hypothetical protein
MVMVKGVAKAACSLPTNQNCREQLKSTYELSNFKQGLTNQAVAPEQLQARGGPYQ